MSRIDRAMFKSNRAMSRIGWAMIKIGAVMCGKSRIHDIVRQVQVEPRQVRHHPLELK
jgi:hypothetical protein